jgi:formiminotetrahydrofolate cyclodeaminase
MPDFTVDLAGIAALVIAALSLYKSFKMTPHEEVVSDADAVTKFATAAGMSADQVIVALKQVEDTNKTMGIMRTELDSLRNEVKKRDELLDEWQMGIESLIRQLKEHNIEPVWKPKPISRQV